MAPASVEQVRYNSKTKTVEKKVLRVINVADGEQQFGKYTLTPTETGFVLEERGREETEPYLFNATDGPKLEDHEDPFMSLDNGITITPVKK
jgi:hypothetical protein